MKTAILSDIHGNSPALRAVLADIRQAGCDRLVVLGDVIPGVDPPGCLNLLMEWNKVICIQGNAEAYMLTPDPNGIPDAQDELYQAIFELVRWYRAEMTAEQLEWVKTWPDRLTLEGALLVHDHPLDRLFPERWRIPGLADAYQELYFHSPGIGSRTPPEKYEEIDRWMEQSCTGLVFAGHTHEPFIRRLPHGIVCNAGSAGTPLDGIPRPSWVLVEGELGPDSPIEIRRTSYDLEKIYALLESRPDYPQFRFAGHAEAYRRMVETGEHWKAFLPRAAKGLAKPSQNQAEIPTHSDESHVQ